MPVHRTLNLYDAGDIICDGDNLENAQIALAHMVASLLRSQYFPIVLGGGHETAWGHYLGIHEALGPSKLAIVNFDAHFDLREQARGSSGTTFKQIADHHAAFDYTVIGIQFS